MKRGPARVLIVDDSALARKTMVELLSGRADIEVMGTAANPYAAAERIRAEVPDVILLDVEMPGMDGLTLLHNIMTQHPIPILICSNSAEKGSANCARAMEFGAVDVIPKPKVTSEHVLEESRESLCAAVLAARGARLRRPLDAASVAPKLTADAVIAKPNPRSLVAATERVVAIGASTGGTEALALILQQLPEDSPGIAVVQHMPEKFTAAFAARLDSICRVAVKEAEDGDLLGSGKVLLAPGGRHLLLKRSGGRYVAEVKDGPPVCRHRPSVDVLFRSAARSAGANAIGILLTGMGDDGARGLLEMKESGATTFAQDEKTCVVFGMPNEAIRRGAAERVLPIQSMAAALLEAGAEPRR